MGLSALATTVLTGAAIGAVTAVVTGGNPFKGAILGGIGGGVGSAVGGAVAGAATGDAIGEAASTAGSVGADAAASTTQNLAQGLIQSAAPEAGGAAAGEVAGGAAGTAGSEVAAGAGDSVLGSAAGDGAATTGSAFSPADLGEVTSSNFLPPGVDQGLIGRMMDWAHANPKLASSVVEAGGKTIAGVGQGLGAQKLAEVKAEQERINKEKLIAYYRDFVQSGSSGGAGVTLPTFKSPTPGLQRPGGGPVFNQSGQLISS